MQNIIRDSGAPVSKSSPRSPGNQVRNGTECTKHKTKCAGDHRPEEGRIYLLKDKNDYGQNAPDIKVSAPPDTEAKDDSFQKDKGINDWKNLFPVDQGIYDDQGGDRFDVGQK